MFKKLIQKLKHNPKTIVFTEGSDPRILEASARLLSGTFLTPILVGNREEVLAAAERECLNVQNVQVLDPASYEGMDEMVEKLVEKMAAEQGVTESLKASDQMKWVGLMNNFKASAEEVVMKELVYA